MNTVGTRLIIILCCILNINNALWGSIIICNSDLEFKLKDFHFNTISHDHQGEEFQHTHTLSDLDSCSKIDELEDHNSCESCSDIQLSEDEIILSIASQKIFQQYSTARFIPICKPAIGLELLNNRMHTATTYHPLSVVLII